MRVPGMPAVRMSMPVRVIVPMRVRVHAAILMLVRVAV